MSTLNPLNDISRTYLDTIAKMNKKEEETEVKRWEGELNLQMKTMANLTKEEKAESSEKEEEDRKKDDDLAGAPNKNGKNGKKKVKRWWDDDGDGKGYEKGEVKEAVYGRSAEKVEASRRKDDDLAGSPMTVTNADKKGNTPAYQAYKAGKKNVKTGKPLYKAADHMKKEGFSSWRDDLREIVSAHPMTDVESEKEVTEKKGIKNKVIINPKMSEAVAAIGGQVISETEVDLQEKHKDTPDQVKAVIAYDRARHATDDATYDTMHGKKKQAKKERDYAKWQRDTGARDAQKSGHPWEHEKYGTREKEGKKSVKHAHVKDSVEYILDNLHHLNEADIADILARLEKKRIRQGGNPDESPLGKKTGRAMKAQQDKGRKKAGMSEGYGKKKKHNCASKVKHEEFGIGNCIKGMHTIDENNMVTHYDVEFAEYIVENCPVEELEILVSEMHVHQEQKAGVVKKEVKALQKAGNTLKGKDVAKADKIDTPNYKGYKFGVKEAKDWIQGAVKRPGAFTRKAKAAGMSVQQFAKHVDKNKDKYSTRTERQANLAQTFASMKKEDVEEMIFNYIAESHENA